MDLKESYVSLPTEPAPSDYNSQKTPFAARRTRGITGHFLIRELGGPVGRISERVRCTAGLQKLRFPACSASRRGRAVEEDARQRAGRPAVLPTAEDLAIVPELL